jgi:undecaprenyl-diphosphatase
MEIFQAIFLGIVQGFTEFLPISSSGHLILVPWFFGWEDSGLAFDVALHFGTLIAVVAYFWKDLIVIVRNGFSGIRSKKSTFTKASSSAEANEDKSVDRQALNSKPMTNKNVEYPKNLLWLLAIATVPGVFAGYFFESQAETILRSPLVIVFSLSIGGLLLYWADRRLRNVKPLKNITIKNTIFIGCAQALAIIPGVSRSGITMTAGLFSNLNRVAVAKFSFLMSIPVIFGAFVYKFNDFAGEGIGIVEIAGIIAAAVSGYLAIAGLIKFVEKTSYKIFFWYRLGLALLILLVWFL